MKHHLRAPASPFRFLQEGSAGSSARPALGLNAPVVQFFILPTFVTALAIQVREYFFHVFPFALQRVDI